jgi:transcriptional regulator with XRE-family HTH domain
MLTVYFLWSLYVCIVFSSFSYLLNFKHLKDTASEGAQQVMSTTHNHDGTSAAAGPEGIGRRIKERRMGLGMEQEELASLIHKSVRSVSAYETGEMNPYRVLDDLAFALGVSKSWLYYGDEGFEGEETKKLLSEIVKTNKAILARLEALTPPQN